MARTRASSSLAKLLRLASWIICLIVAASFLIFVVEKTKSASNHQQEEVNVHQSANTTPAVKHESTLHKTIDKAANFFTSPFSNIVSGSNSEWLIHGVKFALAMLIYGFGLSYLARVIRVRL